ncbi:hypothetical protein H0H87_011621 [Tephrocybe sp. NHM501043]|nr:hypothetical protein H0H87_011621 [Tephrocybe sp. NHM501043]
MTKETPTAFRVHRGVLARHSEVFRGMLDFPQPSSLTESETFDGCQVVEMHDLPADLSNLITALYDGPTFANRRFEDFIYIAGILRLSTKYFVDNLRKRAIQFLSETWPVTLQGHDAMISKAVDTPSTNGITYPYVHPLHILNLAREVNAHSLVPAALYFLSLYNFDDILRADHPKLLVKHPSSPSSTLCPADIGAYTLMYQYRIKVIHEFIRQDPLRASDCSNDAMACIRGFQKLFTRFFRSWQTRTGPIYFLSQAIDAVNDEPYLCELCRIQFRRNASRLREKIWDELPSVVGLPSWPDLIEGD